MNNKQQERKYQVVDSLLAKPIKKPDFSSFGSSEVLKRAAQFMPQFVQTTDKLLNEPDMLKKHQMDITIHNDQEEIKQENNRVNMDIAVGVYDILNQDFNEKAFKPSSTNPIVQVKGMNADLSDDSESSDDSEQNYLEFHSSESDANNDADSVTTKSTNQQRKVLIQDITQKNKSNKSNKRQRRQ